MRDYNHKNFNKDFGITDSQLKNVRDKLQFQKEFCENTLCSVYEDGTFLTLLDITFNPNLNSRYASMTQNRVDTLTKSAKYDNLVPVFLTATLDGFFRDFLRGDYSRYTPEIEEKYKHKIPNSERYGYIKDKIAREEPLTIRDLYKVLLFQFTERFLGSRKMRKIKIEGQKIHYFRAFEPHKKDGVPHLHCLLYIPKDYLAASYQSFIAAFPAPQNHKKLSRR
ncbi:MAG: hypothetical protein LGB05_07880, partial [Sulfurovum sp.]|nr:hypothetical protein [Sulfurovum sp.]